MKFTTYISIILLLISSTVFAQTYAPLPYSTSFEVASFASLPSWTKIEEGSPSANRANVIVTNGNNPFHLTKHLTLDNIGSNNPRTGAAMLHLDLSGQTEVTFSCYFKDYGDEDSTSFDNGDAIYFSDDAGATFTQVFLLLPESRTDKVWQKINLDVDVLAAANGLSLTDSFVIKLQQNDNLQIDEMAATATDGHAYDSIYVRAAPLTAGAISGNDTLCYGETSVTLNNTSFATEGDSIHLYSWQTSPDNSTWTTIGGATSSSYTINGPFTSSFWVRRGVESPIGSGGTGEGIVYTTSSLISYSPVINTNIYGDSILLNSDPATLLVGSPTNTSGSFSTVTGLTDNGNGTAWFDPSSYTNDTIPVFYTYDNLLCSYLDSIHMYISTPTLPLTAGSITGNDTICGSGTNTISFANGTLPTQGTGSYTYSWQTSIDNTNWTTSASSTNTSSWTLPGAITQSFWVRRGVTSGAEGPVYTTPVFVLFAPDVIINFIGLDAQYCNNDTISVLTGIPSGGSFSQTLGTGLTGSNFNPANATSSLNPGAPNNSITYTYTDAYSCVYAETQTTTVKDAPNVTFTDNLGSYVDNDNTYISMTAWATPSGGTFSGDGVVNGSEFNASLSSGVGTKVITYTSTDATNGCSGQATIQAEVVPNSGGSFGGVVNPVCQDGSNMNITVSIPAGYSAYTDFCYTSGWYFGVCNNGAGAPGFTVNSATSLTFSPAAAGPGTYYIYHYSTVPFPPYYQFLSTSLTVRAKPTASITNLDPTYCLDDASTNLIVTLSDGTTASTSTWSGMGTTVGGLFTPSSATAGGPYNISVNASNGVCSNILANQNTTVNALPVVAVNGFDASYCKNSPLDSVFGSPLGGVFTATSGIKENFTDTIIYDPSSVLPGTRSITYSYTDLNGCTNSITPTTEVYNSPTLSITDPSNNPLLSKYCESNSVVLMEGDRKPLGTFIGPGLGFIDAGNGTASLDPSTVISDSLYKIGYTFTDGFGCSDTTFVNVKINSLPEVTFSGLDTQYCVSASSVTLNKDGKPTGVFSGPGITGDNFDPAVGVGTHNITFTYTDLNGCTNDTTKQTRVDSLPITNFTGLPTEICKNGTPVTLTGNFTNNSWYNTTLSGLDSTGIGLASFDPKNASITVGSTYNVKYFYTDGNGCTGTNSKNVFINAIPVVSFSGLSNYYCEDASPINLIGNWAPFGQQGSYSGVGITDLGTDTATFNPTIPISDSTYRLYYTYVDGVTGCSDTDSQEVYIRPLPSVSFSGLDSSQCISDDIDILTESVSPLGGTGSFSGSGVSGVIFNPKVSGVGTNTVTYSYTDAAGCANSFSNTSIVQALPVLTISGLETDYCKDIYLPIDTITGNKIGGTFSGSIFSNFNDSAIIDPTTRSVGSQEVIYSYTDTNGCWNADTQQYVINPLPIPEFSTLDLDYCEDGTSITLNGSINADHPFLRQNSSFYGVGITNTGTNVASFDPKQVPVIPGGITNNSIYFVFEDVNGCLDTVVHTTEVHGLPVISVSLPDSTLCEDDPSVLISRTRPGGTGTENFYLEQGGNIVGGVFDPSSNNNNLGSNNIIFEFTDEWGCQNFDTTQVTVYPLPISEFYLGSFCNDDSISFFDSSYIGSFTLGTNDDVITEWYWTYGDGGQDTIQSPKHQYLIPTTYSIELIVTTREGCSNDHDESILVGAPPVAIFEWDNPCFGENMQFTSLSTEQLVDPISNWNWNFDDGNTSVTENPTHQYSVQNSYDVTLSLMTGSGCVDTLTQTVNIRPVIENYPYIENFEINNGGWFKGGSIAGIADTSSWELGVPNGFTIKDSNNTAWVTKLDGDHSNNERSFIDGPCFDFTNLTRPMIIMDVWADMLEGSDGAALQYSTNSGITWETIGEIGDGINWYNRGSISGNPGQQAINQYGWSYQDSNWVEVRHDLDMLIGEPQVRLRVAFGSDGTSANEGIAIDNIQIRERSRIALIEYFTNSSDANSKQDDDVIDNFIFKNRKDLVDIQYHTEFPGNDEMNSHNPADPSARALFYGAFNVGRGVINGNAYNGVSSEITDNHIKLQILKDSPYSLIVGTENDGTTLNATAYLVPREDVNADVTVHLAIVENQITSLVGINGDTEFRGVLKKMLPSATGTLVKDSLSFGDTVGVAETWTMANVFDVNNLNVIAFVQDNITDEVYQVTTTDTSAVPPVVVPLLSINETLQQDLKVKLFPNPATNEVTVLFNQLVNKPTVQFVDISGKILDNFSFTESMEYVNFELNYPAGMYYVRVLSNERVITQKLIINK